MTVDIFSSRPRDVPDAGRQPPARVRLLDAVPDLAAGVPECDRAVARQAIVAPVVTVARGPFSPSPASPRTFGWLILSGVVLRRTSVADRGVAELLGAGDIIDARADDEPSSMPSRTEYVAHAVTTVVALHDRFRLAARRWPGLHDVLSAQTARQLHRASRHLATLALPRVEDRLVAVFSELADRWGRVTPDGIVIEIRMTHTLLGDLVGSRRPTASLALSQLAASGTLVRRDDETWLLAPARAAA